MRKKSFVVFLLIIVCIFNILTIASCIEDTSGINSKTKINWLIPDNIPIPNTDYINLCLQERGLPFEITFTRKSYENYREEIISAKESKEEIDIIFTGYYNTSNYWSPYYDLINVDVLLPLDNLLNTELGKQLQVNYNQKVWDALNIDGVVYGISTNFITPWQNVAIYNEVLMEKYNLDPSIFEQPIWEWENTLRTVSEGEGDGFIPMIYLDSVYYAMNDHSNTELEFIFSNESTEELIINNMFESEECKKIWATVQSYIEKGYMQNYEQYCESIESGELENSNYLVWLNQINCESYLTENEAIYQNCSFVKRGNTYVGTYLNTLPIGIASWSKHPEEGFTVLASIMSDSDLSNAMLWGKEDVDYSLVNGHAVAAGTVNGYLSPNYNFGNLFIAHPILGEPADKKEAYTQAMLEAEKSKLFGFHFDGTIVAKEINEVTETYFSLYNDYSINVDELSDALNEAGMQQILMEVNRQLVEWQKANEGE